MRVSLWSARRALLFLVLAGALAGAGCEDSTAKKQAIATPPYSAIGLPDTSFGQPDPDPDHAHLRLGYITFGNVTGGGIMDDQGLALALQPGGAILVGGVRSRTGGTDLGDMAVWRLASNGTLDTSFGTAGVTISDSGSDNLDEAWDMTLDSQGRIVLVGSTQAAGFSDEFTVWRMNANGAFDASFNGTGTRVIANVAGGGNASDQALGVAVDASDRVLVAGTGVNAGDNNAFLIRLRAADGGDDNTFGTSSKVNVTSGFFEDFSGVMVDHSGNIVTVGWEHSGAQWYPYVRRWLATNGNPDISFNSASTPGLLLLSDLASTNAITGTDHFRVREDASHNIVVVGTMQYPPADNNAMVFRVTAAGVLDTTFGGTGYVRLGDSAGGVQRARDVTFDTQGRIVVAGEAFLNGSGAVPLWMTVWRLLPNGQLDNSFGNTGIPGGFPGMVQYTGAAGGAGGDGAYAVRVDGAGRIVVAGYSTSASAGLEMAVWRLQ